MYPGIRRLLQPEIRLRRQHVVFVLLHGRRRLRDRGIQVGRRYYPQQLSLAYCVPQIDISRLHISGGFRINMRTAERSQGAWQSQVLLRTCGMHPLHFNDRQSILLLLRSGVHFLVAFVMRQPSQQQGQNHHDNRDRNPQYPPASLLLWLRLMLPIAGHGWLSEVCTHDCAP